MQTSYQYVFEQRERLEETLKLAREELEKSQTREKPYFDRKCKRRELEVGDQVLLLRSTDRNKLVMQWKGPYVVERRVGPVGYVVNVKDKSKVFHVNLLKRYHSRINEENEKRDTSEDGEAVLELVSSAIIAADGEGGTDDAVDDDKLLDVSLCSEQESINDVKLGEELNAEQNAQAQRLIEEFSPVFTNVPGERNLIKHRVKWTSDEPIRSRPYPVPYSGRS